MGTARSLEGPQLTERACTMHSGAGAAPPFNTATRNRGPCRFLYRGFIWIRQRGWEARIQLGNINRGLGDPRINPELEADTGGQRLGGDLAVPCCGWALRWLAGPRLGGGSSGRAAHWGWFLGRGSRRTPTRNPAKQIKTQRKIKTQQKHERKREKNPKNWFNQSWGQKVNQGQSTLGPV